MNRDQCIKGLMVLVVIALGLYWFWGRPEAITDTPDIQQAEQQREVAPSSLEPVAVEETSVMAPAELPIDPLPNVHLTILNSEKQIVSDAVVHLKGFPKGKRKTDELGQVKWTHVPEGMYSVWVNHPAYPEKSVPLDVQGDVTQNVELGFYTLSLSAYEKVTKEHLEKYVVYGKHYNDESFGNTPFKKEVSRSIFGFNSYLEIQCKNGFYRELKIVADGFEELTISSQDLEKSGDKVAGSVYLMPKGVSLSGIVVDEHDQPIVGALVFPNRPPEKIKELQGGIKRTGPDGTFQLEPAFPRFSYVSASHPDYGRAYTVFEDRHRSVPLKIVMKPGGRIFGTVRYRGELVPNQAIVLNYYGQQRLGRWVTNTDELGQYLIEGLPAGKCTLHWEARSVKDDEKKEVLMAVMESKLSAEIMLGVGEEVEHDFNLGGSTGGLEVSFVNLVALEDEIDNIEGLQLNLIEGDTRVFLDLEVGDNSVIVKEEIPVGRWELVIAYVVESNITLNKRNVLIKSGEITVLEVDLLKDTGSLSGTIAQNPNNQDGIVLLYAGFPEGLHERIDEDVNRLFTDQHVPEDLMGLEFSLFGGGGSQNGEQVFEMFALPAGEYTVVALIEYEGILSATVIGGEAVNMTITTAQVEIRAGEHSEVQLKF